MPIGRLSLPHLEFYSKFMPASHASIFNTLTYFERVNYQFLNESFSLDLIRSQMSWISSFELNSSARKIHSFLNNFDVFDLICFTWNVDVKELTSKYNFIMNISDMGKCWHVFIAITYMTKCNLMPKWEKNKPCVTYTLRTLQCISLSI